MGACTGESVGELDRLKRQPDKEKLTGDIMKYTTLLFDVDNTLLDFDANEEESFRSMMLELGETYTDEWYQTYKRINTGLWKRMEKKELSIEEVVNNRFAIFMRHYGREVDGQQWEKVYRRYLNRGTQQIPHVHQVLSELKKSYRLYVITNGMEETQEFRMEHSGLNQYFLDYFISERIGANKPSKEYFDYVKAHIADFQASDTLVIGDSLTSDIKGGNDAGMDTCWFTKDQQAEPKEAVPTYIIHELPEIFSVLS